MTLREIVEKLNATVYLGEERLDEEVTNAFASDLMSDVLTLKETPMLITGLCNVQTIRTCDMATLDIVVFVRNGRHDRAGRRERYGASRHELFDV